MKAVVDYAKTNEGRAVLAEPLFLLKDGEAARIHAGERIPIPRRSVDQFGNVQVVDYQIEETGLTVDVSLREEAEDIASVEVTMVLNEILRFVEQVPVTSGSDFKTKTSLRSGGVYLIGRVDEQEHSKGGGLGFRFGKRERHGARSLQIWARAYRIGGDAQSAASGPSEQGLELLPPVLGQIEQG